MRRMAAGIIRLPGIRCPSSADRNQKYMVRTFKGLHLWLAIWGSIGGPPRRHAIEEPKTRDLSFSFSLALSPALLPFLFPFLPSSFFPIPPLSDWPVASPAPVSKGQEASFRGMPNWQRSPAHLLGRRPPFVSKRRCHLL